MLWRDHEYECPGETNWVEASKVKDSDQWSNVCDEQGSSLQEKGELQDQEEEDEASPLEMLDSKKKGPGTAGAGKAPVSPRPPSSRAATRSSKPNGMLHPSTPPPPNTPRSRPRSLAHSESQRSKKFPTIPVRSPQSLQPPRSPRPGSLPRSKSKKLPTYPAQSPRSPHPPPPPSPRSPRPRSLPRSKSKKFSPFPARSPRSPRTPAQPPPTPRSRPRAKQPGVSKSRSRTRAGGRGRGRGPKKLVTEELYDRRTSRHHSTRGSWNEALQQFETYSYGPELRGEFGPDKQYGEGGPYFRTVRPPSPDWDEEQPDDESLETPEPELSRQTESIGVGTSTWEDDHKSAGTIEQVFNYTTEDAGEEEEGEFEPKTPPITPVQIETWEDKLERFNKMIANQPPISDVSYVYDLRGLHSEPTLAKRRHLRPGISFKKRHLKLKKRSSSMDDHLITTAPYRSLMKRPMTAPDEFCNYIITRKMKYGWSQFFTKEKKRFSFFEELVAKGCVFDSMEVPRNKEEDPPYFIEADKASLRKHIKFARLCFKTKNVYTGNLKKWYFQGRGVYAWMDGATYEGEFLNGVMHGEGKLTWHDDSVYEGQFSKGVRSGWGVYTTGSEGYAYAGDWVAGMPEGKGKIWYDPLKENTDLYDGSWKNGVPDGHGTRVYPNGDRYVGQWVNGVREGKGSMVWLEDRQIYKGEWTNGIPNGKGQHTWFVERSGTSQYATRHVYQGEWVDGVREGIGRMIYPNGSWFEGRWHDGQRQGKGIFVNSSGHMLVGLFRAGAIIGGAHVTLHSPTYECLAHIRQFYERAGKLGQLWGASGQSPNLLRGEPVLTRSELHRPTPAGCSSKGKRRQQNQLLSPDNVYPVTRFGFWLVMKDCPGILSGVTPAEFDKIWGSIESISFQTNHNPFEPVYLWQFLQCLVVVSTVLYIEIPRRRKRWNIGEEPPAEESETDLAHAQKSSSQTSHVDSILKLRYWRDDEPEHEQQEVRILTATVKTAEAEVEGEDDEIEGEVWSSPLNSPTAGGREPSPKDHKRHSLPRQAEMGIGIGRAFEKLLLEKIVPYLDREMGFHLPKIPTPLPNLSDLYKSFHTTFENKGHDIITATQFLQNVLPHRSISVNNDVAQSIFWYRNREPVAAHVDPDYISNFQKGIESQGAADAQPNEKLLGEEFLGEKVQNLEIFKGELKDEVKPSLPSDLPRGTRIGSVQIYGERNSVFGVEKENSAHTAGTLNEGDVGQDQDPALSLIPFAERELSPKPFLWTTKKTCLHVPRKESVLEHLTTWDVIKIFRYLYPSVCGTSHELNLDFEMTFCDWLWCASLVAKVCADREFYVAMKDESPELTTQRVRSRKHPRSRPRPYNSENPKAGLSHSMPLLRSHLAAS